MRPSSGRRRTRSSPRLTKSRPSATGGLPAAPRPARSFHGPPGSAAQLRKSGSCWSAAKPTGLGRLHETFGMRSLRQQRTNGLSEFAIVWPPNKALQLNAMAARPQRNGFTLAKTREHHVMKTVMGLVISAFICFAEAFGQTPSLREPSRIAVFNQGRALAGDTPRHSPAGKWIAFTVRRSTANDVAVVPTAGGEATFLTSNGRSFHPAWSPDGARVAFASSRSDGASDVFLISATGGTAQPITNGPGQKIELDWSPDGKLIVYAGNAGGNWAVWSVPAEGGEPKRLTEHGTDEWNPRWSADGQWIFFSTNWSIDGDINIWKIRASGGDPVAVTAFRSDEFSAAPSPEGKRIAYLTDMTGLWVMDLTGDGPHDGNNNERCSRRRISRHHFVVNRWEDARGRARSASGRNQENRC